MPTNNKLPVRNRLSRSKWSLNNMVSLGCDRRKRDKNLWAPSITWRASAPEGLRISLPFLVAEVGGIRSSSRHWERLLRYSGAVSCLSESLLRRPPTALVIY